MYVVGFCRNCHIGSCILINVVVSVEVAGDRLFVVGASTIGYTRYSMLCKVCHIDVYSCSVLSQWWYKLRQVPLMVSVLGQVPESKWFA